MLFPTSFSVFVTVVVAMFTLVASVGLHGEHRAGFDGFTVHHHGARAADGRLAPNMRTGESGGLAQVMDEERARLHIVGESLSVDREVEFSCHNGNG
ncbi:MAG: hypothetical protein NVS3B5_24210 [Sphingomicrobium sp.]